MKRDEYMKKIYALEGAVTTLPEALIGTARDGYNPLKHSFGDGLYIREIFTPKGQIIITKLHKKDHPFFLLKGEMSILTEEGLVRIKAPYYGITKAGTKRAIYIHEDVIFVTVHATEERELDKIEEEIIAKSYEEFLEYEKCLQIEEV